MYIDIYIYKHIYIGASNSNGEVDLHGLHVDEALKYVEASIQSEIKKPTNGKYNV
jgi:DNA-nicking Smr family endonuclease